MNLKNVKKSLPVLLNVGITPLLVGDAGIGKTESVEQFCKENGYKMIPIRLGQLSDASDLLGLCDFKVNDEGKKVATNFLAPNYLHEALEAAKNGQKFIIFLDEINRAHKDLLQSVFELVYDKRISCNGFHVPEGSGIIAAMNPPTEDYDVLDFTDAAFADRFCHIKVEASVSEWLSYARKIKVDTSIIDFIDEQNSMLEKKRPDFALGVMPSRRSWVIANKLKTVCKDKNVFSELLMGLVGIESGTSYLSFLNNYDKLISVDDILNNYSKVKDKVLKFSSVEESRNDILSSVTDALLDHFSELGDKNKYITKKQSENLIKFIIDIPIGSGFGLAQQLTFKEYKSVVLNKNGEPAHFSKDEKLINYFKGHLEEINKIQEQAKKEKK